MTFSLVFWKHTSACSDPVQHLHPPQPTIRKNLKSSTSTILSHPWAPKASRRSWCCFPPHLQTNPFPPAFLHKVESWYDQDQEDSSRTDSDYTATTFLPHLQLLILSLLHFGPVECSAFLHNPALHCRFPWIPSSCRNWLMLQSFSARKLPRLGFTFSQRHISIC